MQAITTAIKGMTMDVKVTLIVAAQAVSHLLHKLEEVVMMVQFQHHAAAAEQSMLQATAAVENIKPPIVHTRVEVELAQNQMAKAVL